MIFNINNISKLKGGSTCIINIFMNQASNSYLHKYKLECKYQNQYATFSNTSRNMKTVDNEMQAWQIDSSGMLKLQLSSVIIPAIMKPSDVLIKVSAASVNPLDVAKLDGYGKSTFQLMKRFDSILSGNFDSQSEFPLTVGCDFVGEVVRIGQSVTNVKIEDKVWGVVMPHKQGSHAEYAITESCNVCLKPDNLTDIEAATIPYVGLTSWSTAVFSGGIRPNECYNKQILIIGASGGVGTFITQLLSVWGAQIAGLCSENAFELVLSCGATEVHDYRDSQTVERLQSDERFDIIIDAGGGNDSQWINALRSVNGSSYISLRSPLLKYTDESGLLYGSLKSIAKLVKENSIDIPNGKRIKWAYFLPNNTALTEIGKLVADNKIRPVVDKVFKLEDALAAYQHVQKGPNRGKTVIDFS